LAAGPCATPMPSVRAAAAASIMVFMVSLLGPRSRIWRDAAKCRSQVVGSDWLSVCDGWQIDLLLCINNPAFLDFIFA
jgi:hypothetical protein